MNDIKKIIENEGGQKKFSDKYKIPYRTVQGWYGKQRTPADWVVALFEANKSLENKLLENQLLENKLAELAELADDINKFLERFKKIQQDLE